MNLEQNINLTTQKEIIDDKVASVKIINEEDKKIRKNKDLAILAFIVSIGFLIFSIKPISKFWLSTLIIVLITSFCTFSIKNKKLYKIAKLLFVIEIGAIIAIIILILLAVILSGNW